MNNQSLILILRSLFLTSLIIGRNKFFSKWVGHMDKGYKEMKILIIKVPRYRRPKDQNSGQNKSLVVRTWRTHYSNADLCHSIVSKILSKLDLAISRLDSEDFSIQNFINHHLDWAAAYSIASYWSHMPAS